MSVFVSTFFELITILIVFVRLHHPHATELMDASSSKYLADARKGTRPTAVNCANSIHFSVNRADALEVPSQDTSISKPNQDCEDTRFPVVVSNSVLVPRESLQKKIFYRIEALRVLTRIPGS